jgi:membrane protein DedA with SNARE-associated domain
MIRAIERFYRRYPLTTICIASFIAYACLRLAWPLEVGVLAVKP